MPQDDAEVGDEGAKQAQAQQNQPTDRKLRVIPKYAYHLKTLSRAYSNHNAVCFRVTRSFAHSNHCVCSLLSYFSQFHAI